MDNFPNNTNSVNDFDQSAASDPPPLHPPDQGALNQDDRDLERKIEFAQQQEARWQGEPTSQEQADGGPAPIPALPALVPPVRTPIPVLVELHPVPIEESEKVQSLDNDEVWTDIIPHLPDHWHKNSHASVVNQLAKVFRSQYKLVYSDTTFWRHSESENGWKTVSDDAIRRIIMSLDGQPYGRPSQSGLFKTFSVQVAFVQGVLKLLKSELAVPRFFADAPVGYPAKEGLIQLSSENGLTLSPHSPDHRTKAAHVARRPLSADVQGTRPTPLFDAFLKESWDGSDDFDERVNALLTFIGLALLRETWRHKTALLLLGPTDSGKTLLLNLIRELFPKGTHQAVGITKMATNFGMATLLDASVNVVTEMPDKIQGGAEIVKAVLSGDSMTIDRKNKTQVEFECRCAHFFGANDYSDGFDQALRKRFLILEMPHTVPDDEKNHQLPDNLIKEIPGITWAALNAVRKEFIPRGRLVTPPSSKILQEAWTRSCSDKKPKYRPGSVVEAACVERWTSEFVEADSNGFVKTEDIYGRYVCWAATTEKPPKSKALFYRKFASLDFTKANRGGRGYKVSLKAVDPSK